MDDAIGMLALSDVRKDPSEGADDDACYTFERVMTDQEIVHKWEKNGQVASHKGTEAHYGAECFFNGIPFRWWEPDMQVLYDFCRNHLIPHGIVAFQTEKEIVCEEADVAGSLDLIAYDPCADVYHIIDHKRSAKLKMDLRGFGKMKPPFNHLDDCKGASYALQTSIYQFILERDYGLKFGERILLSLHPDQPFCTAVPYLKAEVEFLMQSRIALVSARKSVANAHPDKFKCALTGAPVVDAVRLPDGRVVMEKAAILRDMTYEVDAQVRVEFDEAVDKVCETVELAKQKCVPWRKSMPESGIVPFA